MASNEVSRVDLVAELADTTSGLAYIHRMLELARRAWIADDLVLVIEDEHIGRQVFRAGRRPVTGGWSAQVALGSPPGLHRRPDLGSKTPLQRQLERLCRVALRLDVPKERVAAAMDAGVDRKWPSGLELAVDAVARPVAGAGPAGDDLEMALRAVPDVLCVGVDDPDGDPLTIVTVVDTAAAERLRGQGRMPVTVEIVALESSDRTALVRRLERLPGVDRVEARHGRDGVLEHLTMTISTLGSVQTARGLIDDELGPDFGATKLTYEIVPRYR